MARVKQELDAKESGIASANDIVTISTKSPEYQLELLAGGGYAVKVREITNADGELYKSGVRIGGGQQVIIKTGLLANIPPSVRACVMGDPNALIKHEFIVWNQAFLADGELCIAAYCHGQYIYIRKGDVIGTLYFEKRNPAQVELAQPTPAVKK